MKIEQFPLVNMVTTINAKIIESKMLKILRIFSDIGFLEQFTKPETIIYNFK